MSKPFLLGIDQGTSGSRALIIDREGQIHGYAYRPLDRLYPAPDRVEQNPQAVVDGVAAAIAAAVAEAGCRAHEIAACGIACQRNTDFAWNACSGEPVANAITWQDLRTTAILKAVRRWPGFVEARDRLGYPPGTYMSALHLSWRLQHDLAVQEAAAGGRLRVGLSAAWLVQALGKPAGHYMDRSLAQATGLFDFRAGQYWDAWLAELGVPLEILPAAVPTIHEYGTIRVTDAAGTSADVPVLAMIGDQQGALFGHGCRTPGAAEGTQGTASYVKVFMGDQAPAPDSINVYYAWDLGQGQTYCLEAPTTVAGAAIRWMRDAARLIDSYDELEPVAASVPDTGGVVFVPAFTGLDVPYDDPDARATILGMTLGTQRGHIVRAFMESSGCQFRAGRDTNAGETRLTVDELLVGGGVTTSDTLCQLEADLTGIPVVRSTFGETTAWAAALLAGLGAGTWRDIDALPAAPGVRTRFLPQLDAGARDRGYVRWQQAVELVQAFGRAESDAIE